MVFWVSGERIDTPTPAVFIKHGSRVIGYFKKVPSASGTISPYFRGVVLPASVPGGSCSLWNLVASSPRPLKLEHWFPVRVPCWGHSCRRSHSMAAGFPGRTPAPGQSWFLIHLSPAVAPHPLPLCPITLAQFIIRTFSACHPPLIHSGFQLILNGHQFSSSLRQ